MERSHKKSYIAEFKRLKKMTIKAAKDLCYGQEVIDKLENAKTEGELYRIMRAAREEAI